ncbi:MAG: MBL fold metallo-hydrolase [Chitinophagales bacterium]|nr:MBL fold metallo-hydrolase [Chitinophagales bacterium]MDW8393069.1 MBL fold metallo-hydrolase [Chitinophagales bacterium]
MVRIQVFVFSDFMENTYVLWDDSRQALIIDPGCQHARERNELKRFIAEQELKPVLLINTHGHLDHVFGNRWVKDTWQVPLVMHRADVFLLENLTATAAFYGLTVDPSPMPDRFLNEGDEVRFGHTVLTVIHTPGHSPGSISLVYDQDFVISGDVLFAGSIGRVDLPGGNYDQLMESITKKLFVLPDAMTVYSGHGPTTTLEEEKRTNPFVLEYLAEKR